jgi:curved DNA-binding protein CbpA
MTTMSSQEQTGTTAFKFQEKKEVVFKRKYPKQTPSILQSNPKYKNNNNNNPNDKVAVVSPRAEEEEELSIIPDLYIETITTGFGESPDLFRDVLRVAPTATDREIRIAYFRRGREVLAEGGVRGLDQAATVGDVSNLCRARFQAVSMAYEIVSNPAWKEYYLQHGLIILREIDGDGDGDGQSVDSNDPVKGSAASLPPTTTTTTTRPAVRWNDHVEELVFDREPEELKVVKRKKKKNKTRIVVESEQLDKHLEELDKEAEQHFVADFWDSLEESLDGLLKMGLDGPAAAAAPKTSPTTTSARKKPLNSDASSVSSVKTDDTPFDEERDDDSNLQQILTASGATSSTTTTTTTTGTSNGSESLKRNEPLATSAAPRKADAPSPFRPISPSDFAISSVVSADTRSSEGDLFDLESISFSVENNPFKAEDEQKKGRLSLSPKNTKGQASPNNNNDEDVFAGLEDDANTNTIEKPKAIIALTRSDSPASESLMSDLSESVRPFEADFDRGTKESSGGKADILGERVWSDDDLRGSTDPLDMIGEHCENLCADDVLANLCANDVVTPTPSEEETKEATPDPQIKTSNDEDGFMEYLVAYITAIVHECADKFADVEWDDTILGAFAVNDGEVKGLLHTLEKEMKRTPTIDALDAVKTPTVEAIEAVRSFG